MTHIFQDENHKHNNNKLNLTKNKIMTISSSSHHVLCLFLFSFLCVNSQLPYDVFTVIIKNETPSVVKKHCTIDGKYLNEDRAIELQPGES